MKEQRRKWLAALLVALATAIPALALADVPTQGASASAARKSSNARAYKVAPRRPAGLPESARKYYALTAGVDQMSAKLAESGQLVRFSYRITDVTRAAAMHDKASAPYLLDEKVHAVLQVPTMEKVGPLRQSGPPESGKAYWMVFSNKGNLVKAGHRVSVVIGQFRVDGLIVQ